MIPNLPLYISVLFGITTIASLLLFHWMMRNSPSESVRGKALPVLLAQIVWLILQGTLAFNGVYSTHPEALPPKLFLLGIAPALTVIGWLFLNQRGRSFLDSLSLKTLTWLSIVRIPVEIALFQLYLAGAVPRLMTFEDGNFDIASGLTVPIVAWRGFRRQRTNRKLLLIWNFVCLGLLINVVSKALLAAPFPFQKLALDQPNIAILRFPFVWLPTFIVPVVLFAHLTAIRQLFSPTISPSDPAGNIRIGNRGV